MKIVKLLLNLYYYIYIIAIKICVTNQIIIYYYY